MQHCFVSMRHGELDWWSPPSTGAGIYGRLTALRGPPRVGPTCQRQRFEFLGGAGFFLGGGGCATVTPRCTFLGRLKYHCVTSMWAQRMRGAHPTVEHRRDSRCLCVYFLKDPPRGVVGAAGGAELNSVAACGSTCMWAPDVSETAAPRWHWEIRSRRIRCCYSHPSRSAYARISGRCQPGAINFRDPTVGVLVLYVPSTVNIQQGDGVTVYLHKLQLMNFRCPLYRVIFFSSQVLSFHENFKKSN